MLEGHRGVEAQNEALRECRPVVADAYHHFDVEVNPEPHIKQKSCNWIRIEVKSWIRIRDPAFN
jgi:hypothetical protein